MFPPYWMYQHAGLPPRSNDKYIISTYLLFDRHGPACRLPGQDLLHTGFVTLVWMSVCDPAAALPSRATLPEPPLPDAGTRWALFLDVDGTLLEFADDPSAVVASPALLALLHALHYALDGALALVSGRTLADLDRLLNHAPWAAVGLRVEFAPRRRHLPTFCRGRGAAGAHARCGAGAGRAPRRCASGRQRRCHGTALSDEPRGSCPPRAAALAVVAQLHGYEVQGRQLVVDSNPPA